MSRLMPVHSIAPSAKRLCAALLGLLATCSVSAQCVDRWLTSPVDGVAGMDGVVYALAARSNGDLFAGGLFTVAGSVRVNGVARWNGSAWLPLGSGVNASVNELALLPNGDLVAGGAFTTAGGVAASRIARWDGAAWSSMGLGTNGSVYALAVLPGGDVVAAGAFTT
ncbi:MAG: hypothetical protein EBU31_10785, partial [Proteobacteria bacterium]|nr:hypothetical protein [Pseudomonadota bacterium]